MEVFVAARREAITRIISKKNHQFCNKSVIFQNLEVSLNTCTSKHLLAKDRGFKNSQFSCYFLKSGDSFNFSSQGRVLFEPIFTIEVMVSFFLEKHFASD